MKKNLTLPEAEFVISNWALTAHHQQAAKFVLKGFLEMRKECERLEDRIEELTPPVDSRHIIPVGDHIRIVNELSSTVGKLRQANQELLQKCAAAALDGPVKDRAIQNSRPASDICDPKRNIIGAETRK